MNSNNTVMMNSDSPKFSKLCDSGCGCKIANSLYVIKIDDDIKIVNSRLKPNEILNYIKLIYKEETISIYILPPKDYTNVMKRLIIKNSFVQNEIFDVKVLCDMMVCSANAEYYFSNFIEGPSDNTIEQYNVNPETSFDNTNILFNYEGLDESDNIASVNSSYLVSDNLTTKKYVIYFNTHLCTISIFENSIELKSKDLFPELVEIYNDMLNDTQYSDITEMTKEIYVNMEDAKSSIGKITNDKIVSSKLSFTEITRLIQKYFITDNNVEHRIKFTNIWNIITKNFNISEQYTGYYKHQLPLVLEDMGLNKKRYSDGIYWYGIVERKQDNKDVLLQMKISDKPIQESEYTKKLSSREVQLTEIKNATKETKFIVEWLNK